MVWFLAGPALGSDLLFCGTSMFVAISLALVSRQTRSHASFEPRMTCESSRSLNRHHSSRLYPPSRFLSKIGYPFSALLFALDKSWISSRWAGWDPRVQRC